MGNQKCYQSGGKEYIKVINGHGLGEGFHILYTVL